VANFLKGLSYARGEYICFSDQDDYWRNDKIETLKRVIEKDKDIMLVYSDIEVCNECLDILYPSFWRVSAILPQKGSPKELALLKNISPGCAMMFRRKVKQVLERAPSSIPFMHDHFAFVVACGLGKVSYSKEKLIKYRQHTSNNIGAFYDSIINKERIIRDLRQKIEYLKSFYADELNLDLERMERFCKVLQNANLFTRLSFVDCYLFLRNSKPLNKLLGILDCLSPTLYNWLKKNAFLFSWTKRILFIAWIIIVLLFFTKEFVIFKIAKFLNTK
jgi:hypothetical protein